MPLLFQRHGSIVRYDVKNREALSGAQAVNYFKPQVAELGLSNYKCSC